MDQIKHGNQFTLGKSAIVKKPELVEVGDNVRISEFCYISSACKIGSNCEIAIGASVAGGNGHYTFTMGDYSSLAAGVRIWLASNDYVNDLIAHNVPYVKEIEGNVTMGKFTGIGTNTVVMPNNNIPEGVSIGALSFVPSNFKFKPWTVYAGSPIREIKPRNKENILKVLKLIEGKEICGIIGYAGNRNCTSVLLKGLEKLEYRGSDSAVIAIIDESKTKIFKTTGTIQNLVNTIAKSTVNNCNVGIGHIRWETTDKPLDVNVPPHASNCGKMAIVHNGNIENYKLLRKELEEKGSIFKSDTDTEMIVHLIAAEYNETHNLLTSVQNATKRLRGTYAFCVIHEDEPEKIIATKRFAPLMIGISENENIVGSDMAAINQITNQVIELDDKDVAVITGNSVEIRNGNNDVITKEITYLPVQNDNLQKMGYKHFLLKEIHEQPKVIERNLKLRIKDIDSIVNFPELEKIKPILSKIQNIKIVAAGSSLNAGITGKYIIEDLTGITVETASSTEYIYHNNTTNSSSLVIGISQSGETNNTTSSIQIAKDKKATIIVLTNNLQSSICKLADCVIPINCGTEISVAATKSYTAELLQLYVFALYLCELQNKNIEKVKEIKKELLTVPSKMEEVLNNKSVIEEMSNPLSTFKDFIYVANGTNFATVTEGSQKIKEISYINASSCFAGELKHGPIAMIDRNIAILTILIPNQITYVKMLQNCAEIKARNATLIALTSSNDVQLNEFCDFIIRIPEISEQLSPLITIIPLQLLAYYIADFLGKEIDQPRSLEKSVTAENDIKTPPFFEEF